MANFSQIKDFCSKDISTESIPSSALPRSMKGKIELSNDGPPTNPLQATAPPGVREVKSRVNKSPLATSTPKSQILLPIGFLATSSKSSLNIRQ